MNILNKIFGSKTESLKRRPAKLTCSRCNLPAATPPDEYGPPDERGLDIMVCEGCGAVVHRVCAAGNLGSLSDLHKTKDCKQPFTFKFLRFDIKFDQEYLDALLNGRRLPSEEDYLPRRTTAALETAEQRPKQTGEKSGSARSTAAIRGVADVQRLADDLSSLMSLAARDPERASSRVVELSQLYIEIRSHGDDEAKKRLAEFVSGALDTMLLDFSTFQMREVSPGVRRETALRYDRPHEYLVLMTFLAATRNGGDFPELEPIYRREKASVETPRRRETVVDVGKYVEERRRREGK